MTELREVGIDTDADSLIEIAQQQFAVEFDAELHAAFESTP